jgi:hypothetical protein
MAVLFAVAGVVAAVLLPLARLWMAWERWQTRRLLRAVLARRVRR